VTLLRKSKPVPEPEPAPVLDTAPGKGRATPKRRDSAPKKQPVSAPRTAKEANRLRKQQTAQARKAPGAKSLSTREFREAMRRGDESVLPRRDKGQVRKLARDWVDTHFMFTNFLLIVFPLLLVAGYLPNHLGTFVTIGLFALFGIEWLWTGRRLHKLAVERYCATNDRPWVLGLCAGQRAFMPRRWRQPGAVARRGDKI